MQYNHGDIVLVKYLDISALDARDGFFNRLHRECRNVIGTISTDFEDTQYADHIDDITVVINWSDYLPDMTEFVWYFRPGTDELELLYLG